MSKRLGVWLVLALAMGATQVKAGLINDTVNGTYYFPDLGTVFSDQGNKVVNPNASFTFLTGLPNVTVNVSDTSILATFDASGSYTSGTFNGYVITDITQNPLISGLSLVTNVAGMDAGRVSFTGDSVSVNLQGLTMSADSSILLNLNFGQTSVPEPSSLVLGSSGLLMLGLGMLRRRRRAGTPEKM